MIEKSQVEGLKALDEVLALMPRAVAKRELEQDGIGALKPFVDAWKAAAPVDADPKSSPKRPPGTYRNSIHAGTRLNKSQAKEARASGKSFAEVYAGTNDPAGVQNEFGNAHQAANPHARPAWDQTKQKVLAGVGGRMWKRLEQAIAQRVSKLPK